MISKKNPKINNSEIIPSSNWIIFDPSKEFSKQPKIFLNYEKNPSLKFEKFSDIFMSTQHVQFTDILKSITFNPSNNGLILKIKLRFITEQIIKKFNL